MVYRDSCMDQIREWDRGRRGVNELARTEAIIASVVQSFSASDIESGGIEVDPWVGRWNFRRKGESSFSIVFLFRFVLPSRQYV